MAKGAIIKQGIVYSGGSSSTSTGEDNIIEKISVNGTELEVTDKAVNIDLEPYVLDEDIVVLTAEQIEELIGLSDEELTNLASLLSDQTIELSKTWSSSKIYSELNTTLDSAKQYTLDELAKSIGASYKVVDSVNSMTSAKVLYLLKDADSGLYNIYIYDEDTSTAELIGSFEINLEEYLKISDANQTYVLQTVFDVLSGNIGDVSTLKTTAKVLTDAINEVKDSIDGFSADVVIKKADYDALPDEEKNNGKTYFVPDDETTSDGTDLTQFVKVSDLEDGTITVDNSAKLDGQTSDYYAKADDIDALNSMIGNIGGLNTIYMTASRSDILDCNDLQPGQTGYTYINETLNSPNAAASYLVSCFGSPNSYRVQFAIRVYATDDFQYRSCDNVGKWEAWTRCAQTSKYLPLTGGTLTGELKMGAQLKPNADNAQYLGTSDSAWKYAYANYYGLYKNGQRYGDITVGEEGTADKVGYSYLALGNNKASGVEGNALGYINLYGNNTGCTSLGVTNNTENNITVRLPDKAGTLALQSDVTEVNDKLVASDNTPFRFGVNENGEYGYIITDEAGADTVIPFKTGGIQEYTDTYSGASGEYSFTLPFSPIAFKLETTISTFGTYTGVFCNGAYVASNNSIVGLVSQNDNTFTFTSNQPIESAVITAYA